MSLVYHARLSRAFVCLLFAGPGVLIAGCSLVDAAVRVVQSSAAGPTSQVIPVSSVPFQLAVLAGDPSLLDRPSSTVLMPQPWSDAQWHCLRSRPDASAQAKTLLAHLVLSLQLSPNLPFQGALSVPDLTGRPIAWSTPSADRPMINGQRIDGVTVRTGTGTIVQVAGPVLRSTDIPSCAA